MAAQTTHCEVAGHTEEGSLVLGTVSPCCGQAHVTLDALMWGGSNVIDGQGCHRLNAVSPLLGDLAGAELTLFFQLLSSKHIISTIL